MGSRVSAFSAASTHTHFFQVPQSPITLTMSTVDVTIRAGVVSTFATPEATKKLQELLIRDGKEHHCFFNDRGFHNHLPHHLIAACDMGASPKLLEEIYELEARDQRPVGEPGPPLDDVRWTSRLGDRSAYATYLVFFKEKIAKYGVTKTLEDYLMSPDANFNGASMFGRLFGGALHPIIHIGFGVELGLDSLVAQGLAMCAGTEGNFSSVVADHWSTAMPKVPEVPTKGVTLFSILRQVYESPELTPTLPYVPNDAIGTGFYKISDSPIHTHALRNLYSKWSIDTTLEGAAFDAEISKRIEEAYWQAMLLTAGVGRTGHGPRIDFFLMHAITSAIVLPRLLDALPQKLHKVQMLQGFARACAVWGIARGRPHINASLLMSYPALPAPASLKTSTAADPWAPIITTGLDHFDSHVVKTIRGLYYGHIHYGNVPAGQVFGALDENGNETHPGLAKLDGTAWIRAAGITCTALGWMAFGEEGGKWDRSGLGWDAAWE
ncbi:unnamed protein product [Mycena citricolor]|uniref:Oxidoreductase AflY n=1 Tax=Mycena citricolor TaxID=2018698 RepID=A0AAD2HW17_9AGAR|nr:unnamed protein product [Mycena citricolor]